MPPSPRKRLLEWKYRWVRLYGVPPDVAARSKRAAGRGPDVEVLWGVWVLGPRLATLLDAPQPRTTGSLFWKLRRLRWHRADAEKEGGRATVTA